jgi:fructokinase
MENFYAGIEAGGTKWVCIIAKSPGEILASKRFPTTSPGETIAAAIDFFRSQEKENIKFRAVGIGSFGPLDLNPESETYGCITSTPKPGWQGTNLVDKFEQAFHLPVGFDTDVNAAALGESLWGAGQGYSDFIYLTVGTGIGGAAVVNSRLIHGLVHPEMGHILIPHDRQVDPFPGVCFYHGDCLEGLANGPAIAERWGRKGEQLPPDHPAWQLEAQYLALGLMNLICTLSPQRIILGGGVMNQGQLFPLIRTKVQQLLNDYITAPEIYEKIDEFIVAAGLGNRSGSLGAVALAQQAASRQE